MFLKYFFVGQPHLATYFFFIYSTFFQIELQKFSIAEIFHPVYCTGIQTHNLLIVSSLH